MYFNSSTVTIHKTFTLVNRTRNKRIVMVSSTVLKLNLCTNSLARKYIICIIFHSFPDNLSV